MRIFQCQACQAPVYFENTACLRCGHALAFQSFYQKLVSLQRQNNSWAWVLDDGQSYRYCKNYQYQVCNWLVVSDNLQEYCEACQLNKTIPNLNSTDNLLAWRRLEVAKRRLIYSLKRLRLPIRSKKSPADLGLAFDFLSADDPTANSRPVRTGHAHGLITINLAEADPIHREQFRKKLSEPYRTLIGHFRHEIGHYYWELLIRNQTNQRAQFRALFGDESQDYSAALAAYYQNGAPANWQQKHISAYATAHPWEDWAETWAHYLHIMDTMETAYSFGLSLAPKLSPNSSLSRMVHFDPYEENDFNIIFDTFIPLTFALDSFNRGMGLPDVYPFVVAPLVKEKLSFIHNLILQSKEKLP